jgi:hypothetical protein
VGIVKKQDRYRAYVSDATAKRATLSVWFRGTLSADRLSATSYGVTLDATLTRRSASGTVSLPDGRVLALTARSGFGGGLVEGNYVLSLDTLRVQRGRLLRQSGIWELRLNHGRGSSAAYDRLNQVIGFLDEMILERES